MGSAQWIWAAAAVALAAAYADTLWHTIPRKGSRYLVSATRARVILGIAEGGLLAAAILAPSAPIGGGRTAALGGAAIALSGAALGIWAKQHLGRMFTANLAVKEAHILVTDGPYGIVRHPIYLGIVLFMLGTGLVWDRLPLALLAPAYAVCFAIQLRVEESILTAHFGEEYVHYRSRVPALIPFRRGRRDRAR